MTPDRIVPNRTHNYYLNLKQRRINQSRDANDEKSYSIRKKDLRFYISEHNLPVDLIVDETKRVSLENLN